MQSSIATLREKNGKHLVKLHSKYCNIRSSNSQVDRAVEIGRVVECVVMIDIAVIQKRKDCVGPYCVWTKDVVI
jgi:hypothetical protein